MFELADRPQNIGKILDAGVQLYIACLKRTLPISAMMAGCFALFFLLGVGVTGTFVAAPQDVANLGAGVFIGLALLVIVGALVYLGTFVALIARQWSIAQGDDMGLTPALKRGLRLSLRAVFAGFFYMVVIVVGLILLIIPGLILMVTLILYPTTMVTENAGAYGCLRSSHRLVRGWYTWWKTAVTITVVSVLYILAYALFTVPFGWMGAISSDPIIRQVLPYAGDVLAMLFVGPYSTAAMLVLYHDLRLRKEGGDLEARLDALAPAAR